MVVNVKFLVACIMLVVGPLLLWHLACLLWPVFAGLRKLTPDEAQNNSTFPFPWYVTYADGERAIVTCYRDLKPGRSYKAEFGGGGGGGTSVQVLTSGQGGGGGVVTSGQEGGVGG